MAELVSATVRRVWAETPGLTGVVLEVEAEVAAAYRVPGQVTAVHLEDDKGPLYLALASAPGEARALELLLAPPAVERLQPVEGAQWRIQRPFGNGFALDAAAGHDVLLFAVGSAIAPMRAVVDTIRKDRSRFGRVVIYVGAYTQPDFPYQAEYPAWTADGIEVVEAVDQPWVQDRFRADPCAVENAWAFVCGMSAMMDATTEALVEAGLPAERIGRNW